MRPEQPPRGPPSATHGCSTRDLTVLYRRSGVVGTELEVPPEALSGVAPGTEVVWRVEAITPGGRRISSEAFVSRVP